jgi:hypothetical protein
LGFLEKELGFFRENFKSFHDKLTNLDKQSQKSRQSLEDSLKASMKQELKKERERIDQLILDSLSKASNTGEGKIDHNVISDLINSRISKEMESKMYLDQDKLLELINKHISSFKMHQTENKPVPQYKANIESNNWALRSLGTRIYRLGTTRSYKQNLGWRGWLEAASRPRKVQSPNEVTQGGDCWCIRGSNGEITFAFIQDIPIATINIVHFYGDNLMVKVFGRSKMIHWKEDLLYSGQADQIITIESPNLYRYLRIGFARKDNGALEGEKTCIYRVQIFSTPARINN